MVARDKNVCGLNCKDHMQFLDLTQISLANRKLSVKSTNKTGKKKTSTKASFNEEVNLLVAKAKFLL